MITEDDFEHQVAAMLSRRSLDVEDVAVLTGHLLQTGSKPSSSSSKSRPPRNRSRVLVAALVLMIAGTAAFVAVSGSSSQTVRTASGSSTTTLNAPPASPWGTRVPSARLFPDGFDLASAPSLFSTSGGAETAAVRYIEDRLPELSPFFTIDSAELSDERDQALFGWSWTEQSQLGAQVSGWIYVSLADDLWHVRAATTDGVDMSGLRFTAEGLEGVINSADFNSLTARVWIAPTNELTKGIVEPPADDPFSAVSLNTSEVGAVEFEIRCLDQYRAVASILVGDQPVSISEHLVLNNRPDRLDCEGATFEAGFDLDGGPATTEDPADRTATTGGMPEILDEREIPAVVLDTDQIELPMTLATAYSITGTSDIDRSTSFYIQSFRASVDDFDGPMVFIESSDPGSSLGYDYVNRPDGIDVGGVEFYVLESSSSWQSLIGLGPGQTSVEVTGYGLPLTGLVEFVERMLPPLPDETAWRVPQPGPGIHEVFSGALSATASRGANLKHFTSWEVPGVSGEITLLVSSGGDAYFEASLARIAVTAEITQSRGVIAGRTVVFASLGDFSMAIWRQGPQAVMTLQVTADLGPTTMEDLTGAATELSPEEWDAFREDAPQLPGVDHD